jgi:hypothetical protein
MKQLSAFLIIAAFLGSPAHAAQGIMTCQKPMWVEKPAFNDSDLYTGHLKAICTYKKIVNGDMKKLYVHFHDSVAFGDKINSRVETTDSNKNPAVKYDLTETDDSGTLHTKLQVSSDYDKYAHIVLLSVPQNYSWPANSLRTVRATAHLEKTSDEEFSFVLDSTTTVQKPAVPLLKSMILNQINSRFAQRFQDKLNNYSNEVLKNL